MNEFWVDRSLEARTLAERLLASPAPITVLYGAAESGKTDFIRDCVMPLIPRSSYRNADLADIEKITAGECLFVDSFEELILRPDSARQAAASLRTAERQGFKIVLLVRQDFLNRLFQLQQDVPRLMEAAIELPPIENAQLFDTFLNTVRDRDIHLSETLRNELASDLEMCSARLAVDPELFAVLAAEFQKSQKSEREIGKSDYEAAGRLMGILENHVESLLDAVSDKFEPQMGWAVLETIAKDSAGDEYSLTDVANRFDVPADTASQLVDWLEKNTTLVRKDKLGRRVVRPRQLAVVMETRRQREIDADEHLALMLRQGVRHFIDTATYLSESSFRKIHSRRSSLRANEDEARLMLRCALAYEDARSPQATDHWLRRLQNPEAALEILLDSTFDSRAETRQRATARLCDFNRPEVRRQLHMLALRDPVEAVRSQAIESLGPVKDDALRNELIQEVNDANSPYRLQAIEALRIFNDQETIRTLMKIVHDPAPSGAACRPKAIEVLGRQDAVQPADALLKIALEDDDWRIRHDAASALGSMQSEEPVRAVLDKLRIQKPEAKATPGAARRSIVYVLITPIYAVMAALVILFTFLVHGLLLATMRKVRLAIVITAIEALGIGLLGFTEAALAGVWIIVATLLTGLLVPTRIMLKERGEAASHSRYRKWVDVVLGIVDFLSFFLVFPGLAPLLGGNVRRGLTLIGIGVVGVALVTGALFFQDEFAPFIPLSSVFTVVPWGMIILGGLLLAIAYISGLGFTLFNSYLRPEKKVWMERQDTIYLELLSNPPASRIVAAKLVSEKHDESAWAASLIRRYRSLFQKSINRDSVELLKTGVPAKGWRVTLEYLRAACDVRLSSFPQYLVAAGVAGILTLSAFSAVSYERLQNSPDSLRNVILTSPDIDRRLDAVKKLGILAGSVRQSEFAVRALAETLVKPGIDEFTRREVRAALKEAVAKREELEDDIVTRLGPALKKSGTPEEVQKSIIATFEELQLKSGVDALQEFVEEPLPLETGKNDPESRNDPAIEAKLAAITAIRNMNKFPHEQSETLMRIQSNGVIARRLRNAAATAINEFDLLILAETELEHGQYASAVDRAGAELQRSDDEERKKRARKILAAAHLRWSSTESGNDNYEEAKSHFNTALQFDDPEDAATEISLGLDLAFMAHEKVALKDDAGYKDTFQIALDLQKIAADSPASKVTVESNLAEANLTVGNFAEAERISGALLQDPNLERETKINMLLIRMAARLLNRDDRGAAQVRRDLVKFYDTLPAGFSNNWSYAGTRHYIQTSNLSEEQKRDVLGLMTKIGSKSN